jgi:hypothetical protein
LVDVDAEGCVLGVEVLGDGETPSWLDLARVLKAVRVREFGRKP